MCVQRVTSTSICVRMSRSRLVDRCAIWYVGAVIRCPVLVIILVLCMMVVLGGLGFVLVPIDTGGFQQPTVGFEGRGTDLSRRAYTIFRVKELTKAEKDKDGHRTKISRVYGRHRMTPVPPAPPSANRNSRELRSQSRDLERGLVGSAPETIASRAQNRGATLSELEEGIKQVFEAAGAAETGFSRATALAHVWELSNMSNISPQKAEITRESNETVDAVVDWLFTELDDNGDGVLGMREARSVLGAKVMQWLEGPGETSICPPNVGKGETVDVVFELRGGAEAESATRSTMGMGLFNGAALRHLCAVDDQIRAHPDFKSRCTKHPVTKRCCASRSISTYAAMLANKPWRAWTTATLPVCTRH